MISTHVQLVGDEKLQASLLEELRKALVQSYDIELDFTRRERDAAKARADGASRQASELTAVRDETKKLREHLALAQATIDGLRVEQAKTLKDAQAAVDAARAQAQEAHAAAAAGAVAGAAGGGRGAGAGVGAGGGDGGDALALVRAESGSVRSGGDAEADQEFNNADVDHDGGRHSL